MIDVTFDFNQISDIIMGIDTLYKQTSKARSLRQIFAPQHDIIISIKPQPPLVNYQINSAHRCQ